MDVYTRTGRDVLSALALRDAAGSLPALTHVTITPAVLTGLIGKLLGGDQEP
jgi:hypothetical protein